MPAIPSCWSARWNWTKDLIRCRRKRSNWPAWSNPLRSLSTSPLWGSKVRNPSRAAPCRTDPPASTGSNANLVGLLRSGGCCRLPAARPPARLLEREKRKKRRQNKAGKKDEKEKAFLGGRPRDSEKERDGKEDV